jgi:hypothetical protein
MYNELSRNLANHKASLVEVVEVLITDAVLSLCLLYELKPVLDEDRILTQSSPPIVRLVETRRKAVCTLDKVARLADANATCTARSEQLISYITYSCVRRRKSALIQIQYIT